jgi:AAA15 family ATPase/GTPase
MLIEFSVQNFRSFKEKQRFTLVSSNYEKNLPENVIERELPGLSKTNFLSSAAVYGANASGKTNLFTALVTLRNFVAKSFQAAPEKPTCSQPFKLQKPCLSEPSEFELQFVTDDKRFRYFLSLTPERVIEESLVAYPKGLPQKWFIRQWNEQAQKYVWNFPNPDIKKGLRDISERTRPNVSFLSKAADDGHASLKSVYSWFAKSWRFLNFREKPLSPVFTMKQLKSYEKNKQIISLLQNADFDIIDAKIEEKSLSEILSIKNISPEFLELVQDEIKEANVSSSKFLSISFFHKGDTDNIAMDFDKEESNGTKRYFSLLGPWLDILENGSVALVDELETCLHPLLVIELIKLFNSKLNTKNAQLIFTAHNPLFLDETLLRRDQVWFTEKEQNGSTLLYPLTDYAPRKGEALMKGYLNGRYGGIPFIPNGLNKNE